MCLVYLVIVERGFGLDESDIASVHFFIEATKSDAAFIFAKVQMLVRVCGNRRIVVLNCGRKNSTGRVIGIYSTYSLHAIRNEIVSWLLISMLIILIATM